MTYIRRTSKELDSDVEALLQNIKINIKQYHEQESVFDVTQKNVRLQDITNAFSNKWFDGCIKNYRYLYKGMEKIANNIGIKIVKSEQEPLGVNALGYKDNKEITLNSRNTEVQNVKILLNELVYDKFNTTENFDGYTTQERKFQAELTACIICAHFEIDMREYQLKYLPERAKERTLNDEKDLLKEVRQTAIEYIETVEDVEELLIIDKRQIEQKEPDEKIMYKTIEVNKLDQTKGTVHIYQFNDNPEKCFLGQKKNNTIKRLGVIATMGAVKKVFKEFKKIENDNSKTLIKDKTQEKATMLIQELSLQKVGINTKKISNEI